MRPAIYSLVALGLSLLAVRPAAAQPSGPNGNLPMRADLLQQRLQNDPFEIVEVEKTSGGVMDTAKVTLRFADGLTVRIGPLCSIGAEAGAPRRHQRPDRKSVV